MNLFIYTGASRLNAAVVESATDLTAVSRLPDLIVGDSEPVTVKFLSASGAYESWSGGGTYTLSISIGALGGDGIAAYFQTSSFTTVTNGWTGRLNLASGSLPSVVAGYLAERPGAQSVPLFVQVRVTDADGNTETYARQAVSISGAVSVPTTANSTPVTYATAADVAADASTASAAAIAAAASASAAAGSASTAAGHVTTAGNSATAAAASAVTAGNSATTASGHATTATTQATNAATSSSSASTYKDAAAVSAASATSSAGTATTQAALATTNGAAQVTLAAAQVTLATTQATNAGTSASAAAISAAAALVSEAAALVSKNAAAASAATASAVSGSGNGTFSAAALTGVNSITASASTPLTLTGGTSGASLVLGATTNGVATLKSLGTGRTVISSALGATTPTVAIYNDTTNTRTTLGIIGNGSSSQTMLQFGFGSPTAPSNTAHIFASATDLSLNTAGFTSFGIAGGAEWARFASSTGNLLIGTTTDMTGVAGGVKIAATNASLNSTSGALQVVGGIYAGAASVFGSTIDMGAGTTAASAVRWSTDTTLFRGAAGYLTMGTAAIGGGFSVQNSSVGGQITVQSAGTPMLSLVDTTQAADAKIWSIRSSSSSLILGAWPDNYAGISPAITIARSANTPSLVTITPAATFAGAVTIAGTVIHTLSATPASASATGTVGTMSWDANYIYICTATNTWKRVAIATW